MRRRNRPTDRHREGMATAMFGPGYVSYRHKRGICLMPITATALCADCMANVGGMGEWCLLKNFVWEKAWPKTGQKSVRSPMPMKHFLCLGCTEKRLGRKLTRTDFDMRSKHNKPSNPWRQFPMSRRLRNRLGLRQRSSR